MLGALEKIGENYQSPFNAGFLTHLYLIRADDLVYIHAPGADHVSQPASAIGINPGAIISEFLIRPKTATFSETSSESADGISYSCSLSLPMKGTAPGITNWRHQNGKRRYIILTRDTMGNCYMIGSYENGARVSWSRQVGSTNAHTLSFNLINWHPIQFIPTVDLEALFPHREFDYSFDLSFS